MKLKILIHLILISICYAQSDTSKWVWDRRGDNLRVANGEKQYNGDLASKSLFQVNSNYNDPLRYDITEPTSSYSTTSINQYGSTLGNNRPIYPYRPYPDFVRPANSIDNYPVNNKYIENEYRPLGNGYRPPNGDYSYQHLRPGIGTNGKPILTGPTPSWEKDPNEKYTDYDVCKCVHSFNCNSPGLKFGSCDVNKQYCCFKSKQSENQGNFGIPNTNIYNKPRPRPVLAGPGGPVDFQNRPNQVTRRPPFSSYDNADRELDEAYKKGLASALYEFQDRPSYYNDRLPQGFGDQYRYDRNPYTIPDDYKSLHSSKYGLYDPYTNRYDRSANSSILADDDQEKN